MRVLIDFTQIPLKRTGAGVYAESLALKMPAALGAGDRLLVLVQSDEVELPRLLADAANVEFLSIPARIFRNRMLLMVFEQLALPFLLLKHRIDVLHSLHYTMPWWTPSARVVTFHDLTMLLWPRLHTRGRRLIMPRYMRMAWKRADAILFVSDSTRRDAEKMFPPSRRLRAVTPLGVRSDAFLRASAAEIEESLAEHGIRQPYLLFLGTIEPRKNLTRLIQAFERVADEFPDCALVLAGKLGWEYEPVVDARNASRVSARIRHLGYVSGQTKRCLLAGCAALVYPSIYEGFGLPVLEGMAAGAPVIAGNVSSLPEVAGDAALLIDPESVEEMAEAMRALLADRELAGQYRRRGLERAALFAWERTAAETFRSYEAVFGRRRGGEATPERES